jgi:hypothetical protein
MALLSSFPIIKPSLLLDFANVKALDPRITFTRTTTATYYDGKTVAKAEENLFLQSNSLNSGGWSVSGATYGNSVTAPDGTTTATEVTLVTDDNSRVSYTLPVVNGLDYTFSVWMRISSGSVSVRMGAIVGGVYESKTVTTTWTRFSITNTATTTGNRFPQITRDGTDATIEVWGAQLEQRSAVSAYTPTTTQPIRNYIPVLQTAASGVARFDHNPTTGESLGLLVEEQRTNLFTYSDDFANAAWTKTNTSITANTIVAPDGTLTGDKLVENTATAVHAITQGTVTSGTTYAFTVYAKAGERTKLQLSGMGAEGQGFQTVYDLSTGLVTGAPSGSTMVAVGNGWYRCLLLITASATGGPIIRLRDAGGNNNYTGDGYSGIYIWGAQVEAGAFPTSYIATTSASVTRNADATSMTGTNFSSWFNNAEGTFYSEAVLRVSDGAVLSVNDGSTSNFMSQLYRFGTQMRFWVVSTGTDQATVNTSVSGQTKQASAYKFNDIAQSVNGATVSTDTSAIIPVVSQLNIGLRYTSNNFNSTIKKIAYYPSRLSNAQLQALTAS